MKATVKLKKNIIYFVIIFVIMKGITFRSKAYKQGNSYVIVIPSDFVKHGSIDVSKELMFFVKEVEKDGKTI